MSAISNVKYRQEIFDAISRLEREEKGSSSTVKILIELKEVVAEELSQSLGDGNFNLNSFKSAWITRIVSVMTELNVTSTSKKVSKKDWGNIFGCPSVSTSKARSSSDVDSTSKDSSSESTATLSDRSSTSSLQYQRALKTEEHILFEEVFKKIQSKWILKSGRSVEEVMYEKTRTFKVEHPGHSFILDTEDDIWSDVFSEEELEEIKEEGNSDEFYNKLPEELLNIKTFKEIYDEYCCLEVDKYQFPELYWIKQSILDFIDLFYYSKNINVSTEQDLLDEVYGFVKKSRTISKLSTKNASGSTASAEAKNKRRKLGNVETLQRQKYGDAYDLVFKYHTTEIGCVEVGLENDGPNGTKPLQEKGLKTPRMMKAFCVRLLEQFPTARAGHVTNVGFIISGIYITGLKLTYNRGSVSVLSCSERLKMPESIEQVPALLPPVLALVYNCAQMMKSTVGYLESISSTVSLDKAQKSYFPPCFIVGAKK